MLQRFTERTTTAHEVVTDLLASAMTRIATIYLRMVKMKLMDPEEGKGWSEEKVNEVEMRYRRYLAMQLLRPTVAIVPTKEVDEFWHQHILDTRAYTTDCGRVFGGFLHHFPYFGLRGEEDRRNLHAAFDATCAWYQELFGEKYSDVMAREGAMTCGQCSGSCTSCSAIEPPVLQ